MAHNFKICKFKNAMGFIWESVLLQWSFSHPKELAISDKFSKSSLVATVAVKKPRIAFTASVTRISCEQVPQ